MHILASFDPALGFIVGIAISLIVLLVLELYNNRRVTRLTAPIYEFATKRAEVEAERIVRDATEQARKILADAESSGMALASTHKKTHEDAELAYQQSLKTMLEGWQSRLSDEAKAAESAEAALGEKASSTLESEAEIARDHMSSSMSALESELKKRLEQEVEKAVATARNVATQQEQMHIASMDSHIMTLVRETLRITLKRELPKEIHADLVLAALEEAKANGVF